MKPSTKQIVVNGVKLASGIVIGMSVAIVVTAVVKNNISIENGSRINKAAFKVGTIVIAAIASDVGSTYVINSISQVEAAVETAVQAMKAMLTVAEEPIK